MNKRTLCLFAAITFCVATSVCAQGVKWHPGHYVILDGNTSEQVRMWQIDEIGNEWAIKGVQVRIWWSELEPKKGVYDFSVIDRYLDRLKQQPTTKRLVVRIMDRKFNTTSQWGIVPDYLRTEWKYNGGLIQTRTGYAARLWEQPVMDRLIALYKHIGWRYDGNPYFEGIATEETTLSLKWWPSGYTDDTLEQQYKRFVYSIRSAFPHTNVFLDTNWLGPPSLMGDLIQTLTYAITATGSSNTIPDHMTLGQKVWTGVYGADYRWALPISSSVEAAELGGGAGDFTPWQIATFAYNTLRANYMFWVRNTWAGDASQQWYTGILPYLRKYPPIRTRCPDVYGSCVP